MEAPLTRRCGSCGYRFEESRQTCSYDGKPLPPPDPAAARLGSFRLVERLGDGGMGAVYRAVHERLGRVVAIKLLHRDLTSDRGLVGRFFAEARAANTVRHAHVVEVYDFVESPEDVYFVMEYLKGHDLHEAIHRRGQGRDGMAPARAVSILEQIAAALHATHARNIVHRDLKPENVFLAELAEQPGKVGRRDFVKIFDFGVAKLDRPDGRATVEGAILGTPEYMAPEQASGGGIDGRADIYSMGCIAYEMLTRRQIFGGGIQADILRRQMTMTPPSVRTHAPSVPAALDAAVMRALSKDPAGRPQTALAFAESLAKALGRELESPESFRLSNRATPPSLTTLAMRTPSLTPPRTPSQLTLRVERRAWRPVALAAAVVVLFTGAVVVAKRRGAVRQTVATAPVVVRPTPLVTVLLQSVPDGAEVFDERDARVGVTPCDVVVPAGGARQLRFRKAGFRPVEHRFEPLSDTTIAVRLDPEPRAGARTGRRGASTRRLSDSATIDPFTR